ncbi:MAG: DNA-formamidopyrimidine glycosylase [Bdellovibrionaceae bacterium]|nr:DNA-formamidopyrimidine glycosylase [Pseudobdellovibrionaceae bacterium]
MPELPEVETVRRGLAELVAPNDFIKTVRVHRRDLRFPVPFRFEQSLAGQKIVGFRRRAKYLLWELDRGVFLSHLGMTGTWRRNPSNSKLHDHLELQLGSGDRFVYNDPRRFGFVDYLEKPDWEDSKWFRHLGPEPIDRSRFTGDHLYQRSRGKSTSLKAFLMDQRNVVGVGNIYASEALFLAGLRPTRKAGRLTKAQALSLVEEVHAVIQKAIEAGGTTLKDFRQAGGETGYFQQQLHVYGREGEACGVCAVAIENVTITGRSSFFCPNCQS